MRQRGADPGTGHSPRGRRCEHPSQGDHPQNGRPTSQRPAGRSYAFNTADVHAPLVFYVMVSVGLYFFFCVVTRALAPAVFRVFPFPYSFLLLSHVVVKLFALAGTAYNRWLRSDSSVT